LLSDKRNAGVRFLEYYICGSSVFSGTGISATVTAIGVKVRVVAELFPGQCFYPFGGDIFRGLQMRDQKKGFGWTIFASQTPILLRDAYA